MADSGGRRGASSASQRRRQSELGWLAVEAKAERAQVTDGGGGGGACHPHGLRPCSPPSSAPLRRYRRRLASAYARLCLVRLRSCLLERLHGERERERVRRDRESDRGGRGMTSGPREYFYIFFLTGSPCWCHVCRLKSKPLKTVLRRVIRPVLKV